MKRQTLSRFTILGALLVMTAVSVRAQSERSKVTNIPFNFIVGQKTLPAGDYTVEPYRRDYDKVWLVQSRDGRTRALFITMPLQFSKTQDKSKLVFHKYGNQHFLAQVCLAGGNSGRELFMPRQENELVKKMIERQTIVLANGPTGRN